MKKLLLCVCLIIGIASAKEPTNIMFGIGGGYGTTSMDIVHSHAIRHPSYGFTTNGALAGNIFTGLTNPRWPAQQNMSLTSGAGAWEFLVGYKHFINDWVGFRAYGNIGVQHYKPSMFESKTDPIGLIDYTINADLLINFYETEKWSIGMLAGLGFGGTSFEKNALNQYMYIYDRTTGQPIDKADVQQHFFNANASVGIRGTYFQKVRKPEERVCDENYVDGKRLCRVPIHYIGHSIEVNAKFNLLGYQATPNADIIQSGTDSFASRPQYTVKNPYRITVRYIIDF